MDQDMLCLSLSMEAFLDEGEWNRTNIPTSLVGSILTLHHSCNLIALMHGTRQVGLWSDRISYDNYTAPRTNLYLKMVLELILG